MSGLNIRDAESAYLQARAEVEEWQRQVMAEFLQPEQDLVLAMVWQRIPPAVREQLRARNPEAYAQVEQQVNEARKRYNHGSQE